MEVWKPALPWVPPSNEALGVANVSGQRSPMLVNCDCRDELQASVAVLTLQAAEVALVWRVDRQELSYRRRLFAGGAGVHVDFHADRYFDDLGGLPGHFALLVKKPDEQSIRVTGADVDQASAAVL